MKSADPKDRRSIVQSVRKETFLRLKEIYDKIQSSLTKDEAKDEDVKALKKQYKKIAKTKFAGSAAVDFISGVKGKADLLAGDKPLIGQSTGAQGEKNKYGATLARNACHFVPRMACLGRYHGEAIALARQAFAARDEAKRLQTAFDKEDFSGRPLDQNDATLAIKLKEAEANRLANDALLNNGFGDHYLQDSYASGHMINKTQIMQWYIEFVDTNKEWDYFKEKNWRKVQQMAYNQPGLADAMQYNKKKVKGHGGEQAVEPRKPQSVEDLTGDWTRRFNALGLQVPTSLRTPGTPERVVMEWWQSATGNKIVKREGIWCGACQEPFGNGLRHPARGIDEPEQRWYRAVAGRICREAWRAWMGWGAQKSGTASFTRFNKTIFILREDYVPKDMDRFNEALAKSKGTKDQPGDDSAYQKMAAAVTYGDYFEFMQSGFIQKSTNALHDTFCMGGLKVSSKANGEVFKVYGDDRMFNAGSAPGVKHSAETANKSATRFSTPFPQGMKAESRRRASWTVCPLLWCPWTKMVRNTPLSPSEKWHDPGAGTFAQAILLRQGFPRHELEPHAEVCARRDRQPARY